MNFKFIRSLFSMVMVFTLVLSSGVSSLNITAERVLANGNPFAGGQGIEGDPYEIDDCEQLQDIGYKDEGEFLYLGSYFLLMNDIECDPGFAPIGDSDNPFTGSFNGENPSITISGISIDIPGDDYIGIFASAQDAHFSDFSIVDPYVVGHQYVGGLVGYASNVTIDNVNLISEVEGDDPSTYIRAFNGMYGGGLVGFAAEDTSFSDIVIDGGEVKGSGVVIGGLAGYASEITANNITVRNLLVDGGNNVGGVFGEIEDSTVEGVVVENVRVELDCDLDDKFDICTVDTLENFGLFAGYVDESEISKVFVSNSEVNIIATELDNVGGFAGASADSEYSQIAVQDVTINIASGEVDYVGGLVGRAQDDEYSDVYANVEFAIDSIELKLFAIGGLFGRVQNVDLSNAYSVASGDINLDPLVEPLQVFEDQVSLFGGGPFDFVNPVVGFSVGINYNEVFFDNDVWNEEYGNQNSIGTQKTTEEMKSISTYSDESWDFVDVWALNSQVYQGYPCLLGVTTGCEAEGNGGNVNPPAQPNRPTSSSGSSIATRNNETQQESDSSSDGQGLSYQQELAQVLAKGIVTQEPEAITNKCEALVMMSRAFEWNVPAASGTRYNDVPEWCGSVGAFGTDRGIVEGRTPTSLGMETPVTRHEVAVMLFRELNLQGYEFTGTEERQFSDEIVEWAREAVMTLVREGIIKGFDNGTFGGTQGILKQDLGVMLLRIVTN